MENGMFGSRDAQCEKCRAIYRLGDEHVCSGKVVKEHMDEEEEIVEVDESTTSSTEEEAPKKRKSKKE